ncbi:MAG: hypothetical protein ACOH1Y_00610 [Propionicimonas sp.]
MRGLSAGAAFDVIGTRPVRIGADGTALVDEFLPLEVANLKGISVASATWLIRVGTLPGSADAGDPAV